jgi:hypothetical protein
MAKFLLALLVCIPIGALAEPLVAPGDTRLRHDLELLNDSGVINVPLTAWPVSLGDVHNAIGAADVDDVSEASRAAYDRVREHLALEFETGTVRYRFGLAASENPRVIRGFENTPREEGETSVGLSWIGNRFAVNLAATYASNPFDDEEFRPDGTYVGMALGNWMLTAGWQDRWWGPSRDGSLLLGTNARPTPGIMLQRIASAPFESRWLSWMGPWTLTTFMSLLDDERVVNDAYLFGVRGSFRPVMIAPVMQKRLSICSSAMTIAASMSTLRMNRAISWAVSMFAGRCLAIFPRHSICSGSGKMAAGAAKALVRGSDNSGWSSGALQARYLIALISRYLIPCVARVDSGSVTRSPTVRTNIRSTGQGIATVAATSAIPAMGIPCPTQSVQHWYNPPDLFGMPHCAIWKSTEKVRRTHGIR